MGPCVLQFINSNTFVVSSSVGSVKLLKIDNKEPHLAEFKEMVSWDNIHYFRYAKELLYVTRMGNSCFHCSIRRGGYISNSGW